ncbi:MAG TPA: FHA domain-containing protein, partial [Candidatus Hydrogenedentes bacterium]|nr:FHA domain-containing protein [Candidatus Hydrogenedentota bacterium]
MLNGYIINRTTNHRVRIGERMIIGRGLDADLCIDDRVASRSHIEIVQEKTGFVWRDLGSRNGTYINGVYETSGRLHDGDHLRIGETDLIFELEVAGQRIERIHAAQPFEETLRQASENTPLPPELLKTCSFLNLIYKVMGEIAANYDACRLQDRILATIMPAIKAQRGAVFLANELRQITPCPICGHIHSYIEGELTHAEREGLAISNTVAEQVLRDGKCVFFQDCETAGGASPSESMVALSLRSIICVPLRARTRILGILYIDTNRPDQHYGQDDLLLALAVGATAGFAIENVFMHHEQLDKQHNQQETETAWALQEGFLRRDWDIDDGRFEVYGDAVPAKAAGGDFYDFMRLDEDTIGLLVGDMSGKGVAPAMAMAQLVSDARLLAKELFSPAEVLSALNKQFARRSQRGMYCCMTYARLDLKTGVLVWANAGLLPALF